MGDVRVFVLAIGAMLIGLGLLLGWINYKIDKLKYEINDIYVGKENAAAAVGVLEGLIRNLNAVCQDHQKRLDILEADHPDTDIDYGEVDDQGEVVCVWFEGKKYVPEDKSAEETSTFYADNKVVAETTRPDPQPESRYKCSDCVRFRRERIDGKWCGICSVDNVIMSEDEQYICDKFRLYKPTEVLVQSDKDKVECIRFNHIYWDMGRHNEVDRIMKHVDDLQCAIQRLNMLAHMDCTAQELRQRWEELMRDDT